MQILRRRPVDNTVNCTKDRRRRFIAEHYYNTGSWKLLRILNVFTARNTKPSTASEFNEKTKLYIHLTTDYADHIATDAISSIFYQHENKLLQHTATDILHQSCNHRCMPHAKLLHICNHVCSSSRPLITNEK